MVHIVKRLNHMSCVGNARRVAAKQLIQAHKFQEDDEGGLIILTLLLLVSMLVVGGMATDFMRLERERIKLQSVSDRAVLAAASLNQSIPASEVVENFFEVEGYPGAITTNLDDPDSITKNASASTITIRSQVDIDTFYLRLVGMDTLTAPAASSAIQETGSIEVSLVLDLSGSMRNDMNGVIYKTDSNNNIIYYSDDHPMAGQPEVASQNGTASRLFFLQQAAKIFISDLLRPQYKDLVSINLVPYSTHVALPDELYMALKTTPDSINEDDKLGSSFGELAIGDNYSLPFQYLYVDAEGRPVLWVDEFFNEIDRDNTRGQWVYAEKDSNDNYVRYSGAAAPTLRGIDDNPIQTAWSDGKDVFVNPSRCVEFKPSEYQTVAFNPDRVYEQVPYAVSNHRDGVDDFTLQRTLCPSRSGQSLIFMSQDEEKLHNAIDSYLPTMWTSIHEGMKWGTSLLDPNIRDLIGGIPTVDPAFAGTRPAEYNDGSASKFIVVITDGQLEIGRSLKPEYYDEYRERIGLSTSTTARWGQYDEVSSTNHDSMTTAPLSPSILERDYLKKICDDAAKHVTEVYTISMGLTNQSMTDCASKPGNAFTSSITNETDKPGMDDIFSQISSQITSLRLNQ